MINSLPELLKDRAQISPFKTAFMIYDEQGNWKPVCWGVAYQEIIDLAYHLKGLGIQKGEAVAIISSAKYQWELYHHAILAIGGVVVGIDPNEPPAQMESMINISNVKTVVVDKKERLEKFGKIIFKNHLRLINMSNIEVTTINCVNHLDIVEPSDVATIIFTSGTTGIPKGIPYRHEQLILAVDLLLESYPEIPEESNLVCWLPLSNLFQRIVNICAIGRCGQTYFVEQPEKIVEFLPKINPHFFVAVPRFYEKLYQMFEAKLDEQPKLRAKFLKYCLAQGEGTSLKSKLFKKINNRIFKPFKALFGSNMRYMLSGSAPMPLWLLKRYHSMGLLVLEAYGLSENIVPIALNKPTDYRFGSVGKALTGNELKIAADGELLVKGNGVFSGYLKEEDSNSKTDDGFLHTGDMAEIDKDGFVKLVGRKTELFKTSTGRKIAPAAIEAVIQQMPGVKQSLIFGEGKQFLVALINVNSSSNEGEDHLTNFAQKFSANSAEYLNKMPNYQQPAGVILLSDSFSIERNEMTCNLKLRRKNIFEHYKEQIAQLYEELENNQSSLHQQPIIFNQKSMLVKV
jgi:long-chain acyl-CoA synthetase